MRKTAARAWHVPLKHVLSSGTMLAVLSAIVFVFCNACNPSPDAELRAQFVGHRDDFDKIAAMALLDCKVGGQIIGLDSVPPKDINIPNAQWLQFQALLNATGVKDGVGRRFDYPSAVFLYKECVGGVLSHDCKGYAYSRVPLTPVQNNLDRLAPGFRFEALSADWYLFRDGG